MNQQDQQRCLRFLRRLLSTQKNWMLCHDAETGRATFLAKTGRTTFVAGDVPNIDKDLGDEMVAVAQLLDENKDEEDASR